MSIEAIHDLRGFSDAKGLVNKCCSEIAVKNFNYSHNARFNIQVNESSSITTSGNAHSILAFPVGDDLTDINNWFYMDAQTGEDASPGTRFNTYTNTGTLIHSTNIKWIGTSKKWGNLRGPRIIDFYLNKDKTVGTKTYPDFVLQRPEPDTEAPVVTGVKDQVIEYQSNLDINSETFGKAVATDNVDSYVPANFEIKESSQEKSGFGKYNYKVKVLFTATDRAGNLGSKNVEALVQDTQSPTADTLKDLYVAWKKNLDLSPAVTGYPQNIKDNGGIRDTIYTDESTQVMDGSMDERNYIVSRKFDVIDFSNNDLIISYRIFVSDGTKPSYLKVNREGENLSLGYFADANESVKVQLIDMGSGKVLKTLEEKVLKGDNTITFPQGTLKGIQVIRIIDEDETNIQTKVFVDE